MTTADRILDALAQAEACPGTHKRADYLLAASRLCLRAANEALNVACPRCHGEGTRHYPSTAIWRGGQGCARSTRGTCDACWGTGSTEEAGLDLRELERRAYQRY